MSLIIYLLALLPLFYLLSKGADLVVKNSLIISRKIALPIYVTGLLLGLLTTLPEMTVGINAVFNNISGLSVGNIFGGVIVLFCLILGLSIVLNRSIKTDGRMLNILLIALYLIVAIALGYNNSYSVFEGIILFLLYPIIMLLLYRKQHHFSDVHFIAVREGRIIKEFFLILVGIILVVFFSHYIVEVVLQFLEKFDIPPFLIGVVLFSIGTNLPEISITLKSWRRHAGDLSVSHLLGSAAANMWVLGCLALLRPLKISVHDSFVFLSVVLVTVLTLMVIFYKSGKRFSRLEGAILVSIYLVFVVGLLVLNSKYI